MTPMGLAGDGVMVCTPQSDPSGMGLDAQVKRVALVVQAGGSYPAFNADEVDAARLARALRR